MIEHKEDILTLIRYFINIRRKSRDYKIDEPENSKLIEIRKMCNEYLQKLKKEKNGKLGESNG